MGDFDGERKDLPNATAALVLGALSLVFCWCYGIIGLVTRYSGGGTGLGQPLQGLSGKPGAIHGSIL